MQVAALWAFGVLNGLDVLTTAVGLSRGIPEGNWLPALVLASGGPLAMFALKGLCMGAAGLAAVRLGDRWPVFWRAVYAVSAILAAVVISNLAQIIL